MSDAKVDIGTMGMLSLDEWRTLSPEVTFAGFHALRAENERLAKIVDAARGVSENFAVLCNTASPSFKEQAIRYIDTRVRALVEAYDALDGGSDE